MTAEGSSPPDRIDGLIAAAAGPAAQAAAPTPGLFDLVLVSPGRKKINVIKEVMGLLDLGLKDAKDVVDSTPRVLLTQVPGEVAERAAAALRHVGADVDLRF